MALTGTITPMQVLSIGDLVADLVVTIAQLPVEAHLHQLARSIRIEPGGAGNFLIAGARLGMHMRAIGTLGADIFGQAVAERLEAEQVNLRGVIRSEGSTTTTVIVLIDDQGGHVFLGAYGEGPLLDLPPSWTQEIAASQAVFSAGYTLQEKRICGATFEALQFARRQGVPVFFDPGFEMARCTAEQKRLALAASRVLLLTENELPILTGGETGFPAARCLLESGPELVCLKRGAEGCVIISREQVVTHPGYPVTARDTAAAGDSFAAAFIYAYLKGWPLGDIAAFANAMGAAKVQKVGSGSSVPTAAEVQQVLEAHGVDL
ncbi:MAG TPA: carbohydrate kinase family protein, partial [Levilinea sp.]|nr:carbohydrate kinase family protein [Levilinea sp.]